MEKLVAQAWEENALEWARAIREELIPSRQRATNAAILEAIRKCSGRSALDLGCGEGWLVRAIAELGWEAVGVDASSSLIDMARSLGPDVYHSLRYDQLEARFREETFDLIVANFSLLGGESTEEALKASRKLLRRDGRFLIQTIESESGWQVENWESLGGLNCQSSPWFGRSLSEWRELISSTGWTVDQLERPDPANPSSLLFNLKPN